MQENAGTSLVEAFDLLQIRTHIQMLRTTAATPGSRAQQRSEFDFADDSVCKACLQARLTYEPPSLYCTCCGQRIKRNQVRPLTVTTDSLSLVRPLA